MVIRVAMLEFRLISFRLASGQPWIRLVLSPLNEVGSFREPGTENSHAAFELRNVIIEGFFHRIGWMEKLQESLMLEGFHKNFGSCRSFSSIQQFLIRGSPYGHHAILRLRVPAIYALTQWSKCQRCSHAEGRLFAVWPSTRRWFFVQRTTGVLQFCRLIHNLSQLDLGTEIWGGLRQVEVHALAIVNIWKLKRISHSKRWAIPMEHRCTYGWRFLSKFQGCSTAALRSLDPCGGFLKGGWFISGNSSHS